MHRFNNFINLIDLGVPRMKKVDQENMVCCFEECKGG